MLWGVTSPNSIRLLEQKQNGQLAVNWMMPLIHMSRTFTCFFMHCFETIHNYTLQIPSKLFGKFKNTVLFFYVLDGGIYRVQHAEAQHRENSCWSRVYRRHSDRQWRDEMTDENITCTKYGVQMMLCHSQNQKPVIPTINNHSIKKLLQKWTFVTKVVSPHIQWLWI